MNEKEKLVLYKNTLENIQMIGHNLQHLREQPAALSAAIEMAGDALRKAGDIEED